MKRLILLSSLIVSVLAVCNGCAGYQRGSTVPEGWRTVHVPSFENYTDYPMAGAMTTQQFMDALIEDGTFTLDTFEDAALRVQVSVTSVGSTPVRYDRNYAIVPDEYHLSLTVQLNVYRADTGETLINARSVSVNDATLTRGDYQTGVMDALPRLSRLLGQALVDELHTLER